MLTIGDLRDSLYAILDDVLEAEKLLHTSETPFHRRTYIRNVFSGIEGCIWLMKQTCLKAKAPDGKRIIGLADYLILAEVEYDVKDNGTIKTQSRSIKLAHNLRYTINMVNRLIGTKIDLGVGTASWEDFQKAIKVRNRITHPKTAGDITVSDKEIELCKRVSSWFNTMNATFFQALIRNSEAAKGIDSGNNLGLTTDL